MFYKFLKNVFVTFDQFNESLLNKSVNFFTFFCIFKPLKTSVFKKPNLARSNCQVLQAPPFLPVTQQ